MLTCREIADFLIDYLDGALPVKQRVVFRAHLTICPPCRDYLEQYRSTVDLGRDAFCDDAPDAAPPIDVPEELVQAILKARRTE